MARRKATKKNIREEDDPFLEGDDYGDQDNRRQKALNMKRKNRSDDYSDEEDEDYSDEEISSHKRRRRSSVRNFLDDIAAVADSDEDEEDEDEAEDGFIDDNVSELPKPTPRRGFLQPIDEDDEDDVEAIERRIQERFGSASRADYYDDDEGDENATHVEQQAFLPSIRDPKLWLVKCEIGHEREVAICLMQKSIDRPELQITSALALDHLKNYVYVEAHKEAHVVEACKGVRYVNSKKMMIVPIKEMAAVVSVKTKPIDLAKDTWVRMKVGSYKGDLGQVTYVDDVRQRVTLKLVPRVDLQDIADKLAGLEVVKKAFVPPPRLIDMAEVRDRNIPVNRKHDPYTREYFETISGMMFKDGFLYKSVSMKSISYRDVRPTFDELERFNRSVELENGDFPKTQFLKGDKVVVVKGDLKNMRGTIEKVEEDCVCIEPETRNFPGTLLSVSVKDISKYFETGDHVEVISGSSHEGATGMVVEVKGRVLVILSDASMEEIRVFADNVMKSREVTSSGSVNRKNAYQIHDLVLLNDSSFGLITGMDGGKAYHVLKGTHGHGRRPEIEVVMFRDITSKIEKMGTAEDKFRNRISVKDVVRIVDGPFKGKQGPVGHVYKQTVFIHDSHSIGGFICVKAQSCALLGGSYARNSIKGAGIPQTPGRRSYQSGRRSGQGSIVGTMVKICKGQLKGSRGRVLEVKGSSVRIELESQMRMVTVDLGQISDKVNVTAPSCSNTPKYGLGSETPMRVYDSMNEPGTPMHCGMRTPMRGLAWNPYAPVSPAREAFSPTAGSQLNRGGSPSPGPGSGWGSRNCSAPGTPRC